MTAWFMVAILLPAATGFILCSALWNRPQGLLDWLERSLVSLGVGTGLSSCGFFLGLLTGNRSRSDLLALDLLLLAVAGAVWIATRRIRPDYRTDPSQASLCQTSTITHLLAIPLFVAASIALRYSIRYAASRPHGTWDSWAIWTLRARFFFRSGDHWRNAFSPVIAYTHPDYPILLPATISRLWTYMQNEVLMVPTMVGFFFMLCSVGLVVSSVAGLRSKSQGLLAGAILLTTPFFVKHTVSGDAESPFIFYVLATSVLLIVSEFAPRMLVLAGLTAGLAAWTKNEGLLYLFSAAASLTVVVLVARGWIACRKAVFFFIVGALPVVAVIFLFKSQVHVQDWLFEPSQDGESVLGRLADLSRYSTILKWYLKEILGFGSWRSWRIPMVPLLIAYSLLMGYAQDLQQRLAILVAVGALTGSFIGCFLVYVVTPAPLAWQLETSLNRVLLQLWPALVVAFFSIVHTPEEALAIRQVMGAPKGSKDGQ